MAGDLSVRALVGELALKVLACDQEGLGGVSSPIRGLTAGLPISAPQMIGLSWRIGRGSTRRVGHCSWLELERLLRNDNDDYFGGK